MVLYVLYYFKYSNISLKMAYKREGAICHVTNLLISTDVLTMIFVR